MSEFTTANLQFIEDYDRVEPGEASRLARELLALREVRERAEPVAMSDDQIHDYLQDQINYWHAEAMKYREMTRIPDPQPAPVVPEYLERLRSLISDPQKLPRRKELISGQRYSYVLLEDVEAMVDDACRAAMLATPGKEG